MKETDANEQGIAAYHQLMRHSLFFGYYGSRAKLFSPNCWNPPKSSSYKMHKEKGYLHPSHYYLPCSGSLTPSLSSKDDILVLLLAQNVIPTPTFNLRLLMDILPKEQLLRLSLFICSFLVAVFLSLDLFETVELLTVKFIKLAVDVFDCIFGAGDDDMLDCIDTAVDDLYHVIEDYESGLD